MNWSKPKILLAAAVGAAVAFAINVLALNFMLPERRIQQQVEHQDSTDDPKFRHELSTLLGPPILDGNQVEHFENGDEIFPAMLAAIRGARRSINFETYIYWSGDIGREFADALIEWAQADIPVHVLMDWVGSQRVQQALVDRMRGAGVLVERYHPLQWYHLTRMNNRTHRKPLVVDGRTGFTGGVGMADEWQGQSQDPQHWRDSHYRIEGPAVAQMQAAFLDNWIKTTGKVLRGDDYFPSIGRMGDASAQIFTSSPSGGGDSMLLMYLMAISSSDGNHRLVRVLFRSG